ncbi:hypothetical protein EVAR_22281_1 [Eumeta japonica]|uniref:Uncharacterized protein n=1 Tax=Eumeta variegata TaxID=151549 RepID=A0A4C1UBV6_EUMVA|nr:hypothetical protein EVAR_22281_1 [Eumeta japonica]
MAEEEGMMAKMSVMPFAVTAYESGLYSRGAPIGVSHQNAKKRRIQFTHVAILSLYVFIIIVTVTERFATSFRHRFDRWQSSVDTMHKCCRMRDCITVRAQRGLRRSGGGAEVLRASPSNQKALALILTADASIDEFVQCNARYFAALNCRRMSQCAGLTLPNPSFFFFVRQFYAIATLS